MRAGRGTEGGQGRGFVFGAGWWCCRKILSAFGPAFGGVVVVETTVGVVLFVGRERIRRKSLTIVQHLVDVFADTE